MATCAWVCISHPDPQRKYSFCNNMKGNSHSKRCLLLLKDGDVEAKPGPPTAWKCHCNSHSINCLLLLKDTDVEFHPGPTFGAGAAAIAAALGLVE